MARNVLLPMGGYRSIFVEPPPDPELLKLNPGEKIIHTMGVYSNGDRKHNGVRESHLAEHIEYNKTFRPGRALFVNGKCENEGYLSKDTCDSIEKELKETPKIMTKVTIPYK